MLLVPLDHRNLHKLDQYTSTAVCFCRALPDYLDDPVDLDNGTDHQAVLALAVGRLRNFGVHTVWRWLPDQDIMCLTPAEFRLVCDCCLP